MRSFSTSAMILKKRPLGEKDQVLLLLCEDNQKLEVISRSTRLIASRRGGQLDTLNILRVEIYQGPHTSLLRECQVLESFGKLKGDLNGVLYAQYLAEMVSLFEAESGLFNLVLTTLHQLQAAVSEYEVSKVKALGELMSLPGRQEFSEGQITLRKAFVLEQFKLIFLDRMGVVPELSNCMKCGERWRMEVLQGRVEQIFYDDQAHLHCEKCAGSSTFAGSSIGNERVNSFSFAVIKLANFLRKNPPFSQKIAISRTELKELITLNNLFLQQYHQYEIKSTRFLPTL